MNDCSSEEATLGISNSTQISNHDCVNQNSFQFKINIQNYISKFFSIYFNKSYKKFITYELSDVWDHTIKKMSNYDLKSRMGIKIREWVIFNKLENFNSFLYYTDDDSHHLVGYVFPMTMMKNCQLQLCKNLTISDGIFNISLMKMNINMMMMSGPILHVKAIRFSQQTRNS